MPTATTMSSRLKIGAAALLASTVLATAVVPATAAGFWPPRDERVWQHEQHKRSAFHHHFWRGVPQSTAASAAAADAGMMALGGLDQAMDESMGAGIGDSVDEATSYCLNRFKSYDPSTGSYLGFDGVEHPCP